MSDILEDYKETRFDESAMRMYSSNQIQELIKKGSDKKLGRIKFHIKVELIATILISLIVLTLIYLNFSDNRKLLLTLTIVTITSGFYFFLHRRIGAISFTQSDVKTSLEQAITKLETTIKLYYKITVFGFPILFFGAIALSVFLNKIELSQLWKEDFSLLLIGVMVSFALPPTTRWTLKRLYQKHIEELKTNLKILN